MLTLEKLIQNIILGPLQPKSPLWFISIFPFQTFPFTFVLLLLSVLVQYSLFCWAIQTTLLFTLTLEKTLNYTLRNQVSAISFSLSQFSFAIILLIEQRGGAEIDSRVINDLVSNSCKGILLDHQGTSLLS